MFGEVLNLIYLKLAASVAGSVTWQLPPIKLACAVGSLYNIKISLSQNVQVRHRHSQHSLGAPPEVRDAARIAIRIFPRVFKGRRSSPDPGAELSAQSIRISAQPRRELIPVPPAPRQRRDSGAYEGGPQIPAKTDSADVRGLPVTHAVAAQAQDH